MTQIRQPYVEKATLAESYRASAQIDREEADCLDFDDPRRDACLASARAFEDLAALALQAGGAGDE